MYEYVCTYKGQFLATFQHPQSILCPVLRTDPCQFGWPFLQDGVLFSSRYGKSLHSHQTQ